MLWISSALLVRADTANMNMLEGGGKMNGGRVDVENQITHLKLEMNQILFIYIQFYCSLEIMINIWGLGVYVVEGMYCYATQICLTPST